MRSCLLYNHPHPRKDVLVLDEELQRHRGEFDVIVWNGFSRLRYPIALSYPRLCQDCMVAANCGVSVSGKSYLCVQMDA